MSLSIVIPCYNESENIPLLVNHIHSIGFSTNDTEIIFVDNGSTDHTPKLMKQLLSEPKNFFMMSIRVNKNIGYGNGLMEGILECTGDVISWTHADLQTDINDIYIGYKKIDALNDNKYFLKGKRINRPVLDWILTFGMSVLSSLVLKQRLIDINAQPKMFHRSFLELIKDPPLDFSFDLYFYYIAKKSKYRIIEIPVYFKKRRFGEAKGGGGSSYKIRIKIIKRTLRYILKLKSTKIN